MKVIFLDIDGVLNTFYTFNKINEEYQKTGYKDVAIDLNRVEYLKRIVEETDAKIVLSSSWRHFCIAKNSIITSNDKQMNKLIEIFAHNNLRIYDITPKDVYGIRENEIKTWMCNKNIETFIVIDDDSYDLQSFVDKELIKTNYFNEDIEKCGLCEYHISEAINKLNSKQKILQKIKDDNSL